jgi:hypothetical protein
VLLEKDRGGGRDLRRRERRPAHHRVTGLDEIRGRRLACELRARGQRRDDVRARREQLGLHEAVGGDPARRPRRLRVVAGGERVCGVERADGDRERIVRRREADAIRPEVAGRDDDDDAVGSGRERTGVIRTEDRGAVDDHDVEVPLRLVDELAKPLREQVAALGIDDRRNHPHAAQPARARHIRQPLLAAKCGRKPARVGVEQP